MIGCIEPCDHDAVPAERMNKEIRVERHADMRDAAFARVLLTAEENEVACSDRSVRLILINFRAKPRLSLQMRVARQDNAERFINALHKAGTVEAERCPTSP